MTNPSDRRGLAPSDVDDELAFHLDARTRSLVENGLTPEAARVQALREFGDLDDARRYMTRLETRTTARRQRRHYLADIRQDVGYALRRLRRAPGFALAGILTAALGIGATTAMFSVVYGVLLRPLPFPDPDRLYAVYSASPSRDLLTQGVSPVDLDDWRAQRRLIADIGGYWYSEGSSGVDLIGHGDPRRVSAAYVTAGFFNALGVTPVAGRLPREDELVRGGTLDVVVVTHGFWLRELGGRTEAVGETLTLDGTPVTVIGVTPPAMQFPAPEVELFLPYAAIPDSSIPYGRTVRILGTVARARPGVTREGVEQEMSAVTARLAAEYPENESWGAATVVPLDESMTGSARSGLLVLFGAVGLVLVMACVNVAGLQLARAAARSRELAVRVALGARRGRVMRQLLTESVVIAVIGGLVGIAMSALAVQAVLGLASGRLPRDEAVSLDWAVLTFAVVLSVATGLAFGLAPAWRLRAARPEAALREGGRGAVSHSASRLRSSLVVAEVAVAVVLVVGAGLMARSFLSLTRVDPGFDPARLLAVQFTIDSSRHEPFTSFYREVIDTVRQLPGVVSAAAVKDPPFRGNGERVGFRIPDQPTAAGEDSPTATALHVSDGYFQTIGAVLVDGREFTPRDSDEVPFVVLVNDAFARRHFPGGRAVGRHLQFGQTPIEIVGVVGDIRQVAMAEPAQPTIYVHNLQNGRVKTTLVVRTAGEPERMAATVRDAIWSLDDQQTITSIFTLDDAVGMALAPSRFVAVLLGTFGAIGLTLGVVGVYGVIAALVGQRQREIGVRLALGARPADVLLMIVRRGLLLGGAGVAVGIVAAILLGRFLASVLYDVRPTDIATYAGVAVLLLGSAVFASLIPARRAARLDPVQTLRMD